MNTTAGSITEPQRRKIFYLLEEKGKIKEELEEKVGVKISDLSTYSASQLIGMLSGGIPEDEAVKRIQDAQRISSEKREDEPIPNSEIKNPMVVEPGSTLALARTAGIPEEMANLFFINLNGTAYIKVAGLQYMAGKIGYRRIEIVDHYDEQTKTWTAEARIYPKIDARTLETLSNLTPEVQKMAYYELSKPTNGIGTASKENVQNSRMMPFLREMAQTRALGRALRSYTGYGSTTYEELPDAEIGGD